MLWLERMNLAIEYIEKNILERFEFSDNYKIGEVLLPIIRKL